MATRMQLARSTMACALLCAIAPVHASLLQGEALDTMADGASWLVLVVAPIVGIVVFWLVHIIPEKIAEKKHHPQAKAIQALCLLSLVFGGLLWPLAMLWAVTRPVIHKAAYGYDKMPHGREPEPEPLPPQEELQRIRAQLDLFAAAPPTAEQVQELRARLAALEATPPTITN